MGGDAQRLARGGVARDHELATGPRRAHHLLGRDPGDRLPALEPPEIGAGRDAQRRRGLGIELSGTLVLIDDVAEPRPSVDHRHRRNPVAVAPELLSGLELDEHELVADPARGPERERHQLL